MATFGEAPSGDAAKGGCWGNGVWAPGFGFCRAGGRASHRPPLGPSGAPQQPGPCLMRMLVARWGSGLPPSPQSPPFPTPTLAFRAPSQLLGIVQCFVGTAALRPAAGRPPELPPALYRRRRRPPACPLAPPSCPQAPRSSRPSAPSATPRRLARATSRVPTWAACSAGSRARLRASGAAAASALRNQQSQACGGRQGQTMQPGHSNGSRRSRRHCQRHS